MDPKKDPAPADPPADPKPAPATPPENRASRLVAMFQEQIKSLDGRLKVFEDAGLIKDPAKVADLIDKADEFDNIFDRAASAVAGFFSGGK